MCSKAWRCTSVRLGVWGEIIRKKITRAKTADTQCTTSKTKEKTNSTQSKQTHGSVTTVKEQSKNHANTKE